MPSKIHEIELGSQGNFTWVSEVDAKQRPIDTLADHGLLADNGLLSNKIINEYGSLVFKDIQARMDHTELKTQDGKDYRKKRSYWQALKDRSKRTEQSNLSKIQSNTDKAIYTERQLAEHMVEMVHLLQPIEALLNRPDLSRDDLLAVLKNVKDTISAHQFPEFKFSDLPGFDTIIKAEKDDLSDLFKAIERLEKRVKDNTDNNAEIQKWLLKRFDQMNRGFEIRVRNVNIYKARGNTGGLTLGRAYDTVQNVKKLSRLTGHYYAEAGRITPEMQHQPDATRAAFNSERYPLKKASGDDQGNALKLAHYTATNGDYVQAQLAYREHKDEMLKEYKKKPKRSPLTIIASAVRNFGSSLQAKATEEMDFSFGKSWRSSITTEKQKQALQLLHECLIQVAQSNETHVSKQESQQTLSLNELDGEHKNNQKAQDKPKPTMQFAYPSGSLQLAAMGDFFTSTTKFTENFIEFFAEEFADKRPFISAVAFSIYGLCGLTVFDPVMAKAVVGLVTKSIEEIAAGLAIHKLAGSPVVLSPDAVIAAISKEATFIAEHLGSNGSIGSKLVTSSLINMQGYVFAADLMALPANETGFIQEIIAVARKNPLTRETMIDTMKKYGVDVGRAAFILGIGMATGIFASYLGAHTPIALNKIFELPIEHLFDPTLAPGAAFNASLITLKSVGAFYEAVYTAGSEVSRAGVPIENNDIDYALLVMFLSNDLQKQLHDYKNEAVVKDQLRRLLREYPGLIKHSGMREVAEQFNCVPAQSSWGATLIWGLLKPVVITSTMLINIPRLIYHAIASDKNSDGYQSALRSVVRGPIAGWLLAKRIATTGITFGRMLTRLSIEISFRIVNKLMTLADAAVTGVSKSFNAGIYKWWRTRGKPPFTQERIVTEINELNASLEADYIHRCQNRNRRFVNFIGWLDDNIAKPVTNVLFRNAEQTTQLLLATGTVTREQRKAMHDETLNQIKQIQASEQHKEIRQTTQDVFVRFNIDRSAQHLHTPMVAIESAKTVPFTPQNSSPTLFLPGQEPLPPRTEQESQQKEKIDKIPGVDSNTV